jgi:hypothetical protein
MTSERRRDFLGGVGVVALSGFAGCIFGGSGGGSDDAYDAVMRNGISESDLAGAAGFSTSATATLSLEVERDDEVLFERTLELAAGEERTFEGGVEVLEDGPAYFANARIEPLTDASGRARRTRAGTRFTASGEDAPENGTVVASVFDGQDGDPLVPIVDLDV